MRALRNFLVRLFLLITVIGILFGVVFGLTPMANADMQPAVCAGDLMLYYRLDKNLKSDDVVVFQKEGIQYTGRIVAVPGDVVEITDESELMVNKNTGDVGARRGKPGCTARRRKKTGRKTPCRLFY